MCVVVVHGREYERELLMHGVAIREIVSHWGSACIARVSRLKTNTHLCVGHVLAEMCSTSRLQLCATAGGK
jgi:hypothetical protein